MRKDGFGVGNGVGRGEGGGGSGRLPSRIFDNFY